MAFTPQTAVNVLKTATFVAKRQLLSQNDNFCPNDGKSPKIALTKTSPLKRRNILKRAVYIPKTVTFVPKRQFLSQR